MTLRQADLSNAVEAFNREAVLSTSPGRETRGEQLTPDELEDSIGNGLTKAGWTEITRSTLRLRFERQRDQLAVRHSVVPAERTNVVKLARPSTSLAISSGDVRARRVPIDLPIADGSRVRVSAPDRSIGDTFPKASDEQTRPSDKRQMLELDLDEDMHAVELEIRSRPFRNEIGERLVNLTHWSALGWLLALVIAVANEGFRDWLKTRLFGKQDPRPTQGNQAD